MDEPQQRMDMDATFNPVPRGYREVAHAPLATLLQSLDEPALELNDSLLLAHLETEGQSAEHIPMRGGDELLAAYSELAKSSVVGAVRKRGC